MRAPLVFPQQAIPPRNDLREMLRRHVKVRSLACMEVAAARRESAMSSAADLAAYQNTVRSAVRGFYGILPAGPLAPPPIGKVVGGSVHAGFRLENVLFETWPGWQVNASVYVPTEAEPPFPVVIVPVGHSGKQEASYQLPCQLFAKAGFLAICFDPPGQAGEKQPGNDHFRDGVRDYLLGRTSSRYFIADAIRCLDYAGTRSDTDLSAGAAMTGVSGGGTTTTFAALLDARIAVIGPSCCVSPLADLDIAQGYAGCPETHMFRRYAEGVDEVDLICAAAPVPCLLMAGKQDEVFRIEDTRRLAEVAARFYGAAGASDRFEFFEDAGGHAYSLTQARAFVRFLNHWLRNEPDRPALDLPDESFAMLPHDALRCRPRTDVNMFTLAVAEADTLAANRDQSPAAVRRAAVAVAGASIPAAVPDAEEGRPVQVWFHDWRSIMIRPEPDIELPATLLTARTASPTGAILHLDDKGRHRLLQRYGPLAQAAHVLARDAEPRHLLAVDLRGWGDTAPAVHPYELAGWGGVDRWAAYATAALGDPLMAMRVRDALAALAWLRTRPEVDPDRIVLTGCGLAGIVALHAAALDGDLAGVVVWDTLSSFRSLLAAEQYPWPADTFLPNILKHYDLPDLAAVVPCPVRVHNLLAGSGGPAGPEELAPWRESGTIAVSVAGTAWNLTEAVNRCVMDGPVYRHLRRCEPQVWINPNRQPAAEALPHLPMTVADLTDAEARWRRFAPLMVILFPGLRQSHGMIESSLLPAAKLAQRILPAGWGTLFVKADHALPVAGSVKARGGLYAVLGLAEQVAFEHGLLNGVGDDYRKLASPKARAVFAGYELSVGSTGNLGLSIGIAGKALGFEVAVHMSAEAKEWKKARLRECGVRVVEHAADYTAACAAARAAAEGHPQRRFIDDENSRDLFLGYACAVPHLRAQLAEAGITVDPGHPLFLYLPCGVGGAPGGIAFAARHVFGDDVHVFFAEPVEAPGMLFGLLTGRHEAASVYSLGLALKTDADGLATSRPSRLVGPIMAPVLDGCCTLTDATLYRHLLDLYEAEGLEVEPSAAIACGVPRLLAETGAGRGYLRTRGLEPLLARATHVVWTTGGRFVPPDQHARFRDKARGTNA